MKKKLFKKDITENPDNRSMSVKSFDIEKNSFDIIESEVGKHTYTKEFEWDIVRRVIHATADFEFAHKEKLVFHNDAIASGFQAIKNKCNIITDVEMVKVGISQNSLTNLNLKCICKISDSNIINKAKRLNKTRAEMAMINLAQEMKGGIVVIGNAPTALQEVIRMVNEKITIPSLIVGVPVGFVSAMESKIELSQSNIPHITNLGRKGGSAVASSITNALMLLYMHKKK